MDQRGWSNWAVEWRDFDRFAGFAGLPVPRRAKRCMPCVELGYRLGREHRGHG